MHPVMRAIEHHVNPVDAYLDVFVDSYVGRHNIVTLTPTLANICDGQKNLDEGRVLVLSWSLKTTVISF